MLTSEKKKREQIQVLCIDDLVPEEHLLRKIENAIDWSFIYELVCVMFITQYRKTIDFHATNSLIMYAKGDSKEKILPAVAFCVRNTNTGTILLF